MLLNRLPLGKEPKLLTPLDLHTLGTPLAFVLSQDQTLHPNWISLTVETVSLDFHQTHQSQSEPIET